MSDSYNNRAEYFLHKWLPLIVPAEELASQAGAPDSYIVELYKAAYPNVYQYGPHADDMLAALDTLYERVDLIKDADGSLSNFIRDIAHLGVLVYRELKIGPEGKDNFWDIPEIVYLCRDIEQMERHALYNLVTLEMLDKYNNLKNLISIHAINQALTRVTQNVDFGSLKATDYFAGLQIYLEFFLYRGNLHKIVDYRDLYHNIYACSYKWGLKLPIKDAGE
jgi:hypothetical protein